MLTKGNVGQYGMDAPAEFEGLASDSREVKPGYLFAALPGTRTDGSEYIADAIAQGATAILGRPELAARVRALGVQFLADENPRLRLTHLAAGFFSGQPATIAAITGTNGKTSVAVFLRQIWMQNGVRAASLGTIGLLTPKRETSLHHTTPDPIALHRLLADLKRSGIEHLALEASSHGLDQYRLDGVQISAAAFTNISRDHLDYHTTFEHYLAAKLRLFSDLVRDGGVAVVNADAEHAERFVAAARARRLHLLTIGLAGETLRLVSQEAHSGGLHLHILYRGVERSIFLPLAGLFQGYNALAAAALALGLGEPEDKVLTALTRLRGAPGRLEKVAYSPAGAPVYVDYAHTPDALRTVLTALRPHVRGRLHVVFGCGGDRDKGKRPLMGAAAAKHADAVIVTDDNPRSEDPAGIRREALAGCHSALEIGDRAEAIHAGIAALEAGDLLVIAGKGHERGQIVGTDVRAFSDREQAVKAAIALGGCAAETA
ncbi:MAG: UDP-N-acetylmuramoyl-L-alanyl-D-glutamate--2,6-diaminopimelate ligase [Alphaproteobacteria bacterium]|nr:UDP-N-acetylmuramoyl-L-alanyl-D-glutamate--2,6-diaminopimelate ligase [Alphaproteobacteria bacterium]